MKRAFFLVSFCCIMLMASALPALAAPPGNDTIAGATAVEVGFTQSLDTSEATTDAIDEGLNVECGAPATDASVWYVYTPEEDGGVVIDVSDSNYSAGVLVGSGEPDNLLLEACGPGSVGLSVQAGVTYYVLAIDDQLDGGGNGGMLEISFTEAPPPPSVDVQVDPFGRFDPRTGEAYLTGTYTCADGDFLEVFGDVRQRAGRAYITGFFGFFDVDTCDGTPHEWSAVVVPENGRFAGGRALTVVFGFSCGAFECAESYAEQTVKLRGGG